MEKAKKLIRGIAIAAMCLNAWLLANVIGATWVFTNHAQLALLIVSVISLAISCLPLLIVRKNITKEKIILSFVLIFLAILIPVLAILTCLR